MSRIFVLMTVSTVLIAGGGALTIAQDDSGASGPQFDAITELFASGIEISTAVPLVLAAGLVIATVGVLSRA